MRTIKKTKTVEVDYEEYETTDGKTFSDKEEAKLHEDILNLRKKEYPKCKGKKRINGRMETLTWNFGHNSEERWTDDRCPECDGKGYQEQKWI